VVAVSPPLQERLQKLRDEVLLIPNGVEVAHFAATEQADPAPDILAELERTCPGRRTVVGLVGHLGDRVDTAMLQAVVDRGHAVLLVGPLQRSASPGRMDALIEQDGVCWVGPRSYRDLPAVFACADVWLLPYADTEFNRASFPLKLLEYLAAGRRVVATDLPAVGWLGTDLVATGNDPMSFADAVDAATATPSSRSEREARLRFAGGHSWAGRVELLARAIGLALNETPAPSPAPDLSTIPRGI
jgi:teichuronic acid biosynthesis glycosyltransferase TuaH